MNARASLPIHDDTVQMPGPEERLLFALMETEKAIQEHRLDDAARGMGQLPVIAANAGRPLTPDELRVLNRVTTSFAHAVLETW